MLQIILYAIGVYIIWFGIALAWFITNLGNKNKEGKWWEWLLFPALMPALLLISMWHKRKGNRK